jgi:hypothetical protein
LALFTSNPAEVFGATFNDIPGGPHANYCLEWLGAYSLQEGMKYLTPIMVGVINVVGGIVFKGMAGFEKKHTVNDETASYFKMLAYQNYTNISLLLLIINFNPTKTQGNLLGFLPILSGNYFDFDSKWYSDIGTSLQITLMIQLISPFLSKLVPPLIKITMRLIDRGCRKSIITKEGRVRSRQVIQEDLETLYTGTHIDSSFVNAQSLAYFWSVLTFSTGLPMLYILGALFYFLLYWVYKLMLLKHFMKTTQFNESLCIESTLLMSRFGLLFHLAVGSFMLS